MTSSALRSTLRPLLKDAHELNEAHLILQQPETQKAWRDGALSRAVVVMCVSAWEAYLEELTLEAVETFRPEDPTNTTWQSLKAQANTKTRNFNNPTVANVDRLLLEAIGFSGLSKHWKWKGTDPGKAASRLSTSIIARHQIAHGSQPRPVISNYEAQQIPFFFTRLGLSTDNAVRRYLVNELHVTHPWPEDDA